MSGAVANSELRNFAREFLQITAEHDRFCAIEGEARGLAKRKFDAHLSDLEQRASVIRACVKKLPTREPSDLRAKACVILAEANAAGTDPLVLSLAGDILGLDFHELGFAPADMAQALLQREFQ